jgi:glutamyl-tRNA(Gln) amidotransferase subunit E
MSIKGGNRVEIKGMQDMKMFIKTINMEIERQLAVVKGGKKVEKEVRNAMPGGTTEFLRPMPGSARMYPETDLPLLKIHLDFINHAKRELPRLKSEIEGDLRKQGLNEDMITLLFRQGKLEEFKDLLKIINQPVLVAKILLMYPVEIAKRNNISEEVMDDKLNQEILTIILNSLVKNKIEESDIKQIMEKILSGESIGDALKIKRADSSAVEKQIIDLIKKKPGLSANAYMGLVMAQFKGQVDGKAAIEIIKKYVK